MSGLKPLIPESKLCELINKRMSELRLSQRRIAAALDIPQSDISRSLSGRKGLRYDELQRIIEYVLSIESLVQTDVRAIDLAVLVDDLAWVYNEASIGTVVEIMLEGGFSQIPVKDIDDDEFTGVVTDLGILGSMILPASGRPGVVSLDDLRKTSVEESNLVEAIADCPPDVPLSVVAQLLVHFPALLLRDDLGDVKGIITRADLLTLLKPPD